MNKEQVRLIRAACGYAMQQHNRYLTGYARRIGGFCLPGLR